MWLIKIGAFAALATITVTGVAIGFVKSFSAQTRYNVAVYKSAEDAQGPELERIQKDRRTAPLQAVGGIAESALGAQSLAAPGTAPNPIGVGVGEGWTFGQLFVQGAEDRAQASSSEEPSGSKAPAEAAKESLPAALTASGVSVDAAPDDYYVAWYVVRDGRRFLLLTSVERYRRPGTMESVFGHYGDATPLKKVAIGNASWSRAEIEFLVGDNVTEWTDDGGGDCGVLGGVRYDFRMTMTIPDKYRE